MTASYALERMDVRDLERPSLVRLDRRIHVGIGRRCAEGSGAVGRLQAGGERTVMTSAELERLICSKVLP